MSVYGLDPEHDRAVRRMEAQAHGLGLFVCMFLVVALAVAAVALNQFIAVVAPGEVSGGNP